jgi:hypothetical protein
MKIKRIYKEHDYCPIRWFVILDDDSIITIRERCNNCIVYKEDKSIFSVTDEDVLLEFVTQESNDDSTLLIAIDKLGAEILPSAMDYLHESWYDYKNEH